MTAHSRHVQIDELYSIMSGIISKAAHGSMWIADWLVLVGGLVGRSIGRLFGWLAGWKNKL